MALGFGANARLIAAYETTYGIPLTDGYHRLGFSRYGLSARQQLIDNDLLGEGRDPAPAVLGALTDLIQKVSSVALRMGQSATR